MNNSRDIEQLSLYLDGRLSSSESARVESRLSTDPEFASAFNDIRAARGILRRLPVRKAPRNFTLTRQMVGVKPPLPRSYSAFRFSSAFAAFLLMLTFAANALIPRISFGAAAPVAQASNFCVGCGGAAATEAPAVAAAPSSEMAVAPTDVLPATSADSARKAGPVTSSAEAPQTLSASPNQPQAGNEAGVPLIWQIVLLVGALASAVIAFSISQNAKKKWS